MKTNSPACLDPVYKSILFRNTGINVPMSVGPERMTKDKNGRDCISYDIIVNPKVLQECEADKTGTYR